MTRAVVFFDVEWDIDVEGIVTAERPPAGGALGYEVIGKPRAGKSVQVRKHNGHIYKSPKVVACRTGT